MNPKYWKDPYGMCSVVLPKRRYRVVRQTNCLECFVCVRRNNFGQTQQVLSPSTLKARSSQLWRFVIILISRSTWHCDGTHAAKRRVHWHGIIDVSFVTTVALLCNKQLRIYILFSFPFVIPLPVPTQWVLYRKTEGQELKSTLRILSRY